MEQAAFFFSTAREMVANEVLDVSLSKHFGDYSPAWWLKGPHLQTLVGVFAGPWPNLPRAERVTIELD